MQLNCALGSCINKNIVHAYIDRRSYLSTSSGTRFTSTKKPELPHSPFSTDAVSLMVKLETGSLVLLRSL